MIKSLRIRLLPNQEQEQLLWKHVNCARFVWNWGLAYERDLFSSGEKHLSGYSLKKVLTQLKQKEDYTWLNEVSAQTLNTTILDLDKAYDRMFKKTSRAPKFKKKNKCKISFPARYDSVYFNNNCVNLEKIGKVKYQTDKELPQGREYCGRFSNPRVKYINDKWILSFGIECDNQAPELTDYSMGIDLGVKDLAVVSFNYQHYVYGNINKDKTIIRLKSKLKHLQRNVSRKYDFNNKNHIYDERWVKSNNISKTEHMIKKIHTRLSNIRKNYIHQATHELVSMLPKKVIMEDLNISGMMKNRHLSNAIQEQCLYEFIRQMKYKCQFYGIEFIQVGRFYPSSKTCSSCGCIKKDLKLKERVYKCEHCGLEIDRDYNAAINLMNYSNV